MIYNNTAPIPRLAFGSSPLLERPQATIYSSINLQSMRIDDVSRKTLAESIWSKVDTGARAWAFISQAEFCWSKISSQNSPRLPFLDLIGSGIGIFLGTGQIKQSVEELEKAQKVDDSEGAVLAKANIVSGSLGLSSSSFMLLSLVASEANWGSNLASSSGFIGTALMGIGSVLGIGVSAYRLTQLASMGKELSRLQKDLNSPNSQVAANRALEFLRGEVAIDESISYDLASSIDEKNSALNVFQRKGLFTAECSKLTKNKMRHFKRRAGLKSIQSIVGQAESLLSGLQDSSTSGKAIEKTVTLLASIQSENRKKTAFYVATLSASILGFASFIMATFFSLGILPYILLFVSGSISFIAMLVKWLAVKS